MWERSYFIENPQNRQQQTNCDSHNYTRHQCRHRKERMQLTRCEVYEAQAVKAKSGLACHGNLQNESNKPCPTTRNIRRPDTRRAQQLTPQLIFYARSRQNMEYDARNPATLSRPRRRENCAMTAYSGDYLLPQQYGLIKGVLLVRNTAIHLQSGEPQTIPHNRHEADTTFIVRTALHRTLYLLP